MTLALTPDYIDAVAWRHDFHAHPELAFHEHRTAELIATKLREFGLFVETGIGKTGVVGKLRGALGPGKSIAIRSEMDALPILETSGVKYASSFSGKMHACGHDGHAAILLEAARRLAENPHFYGTVNFIFQPAEEQEGGAKAMLEDGLIERFPFEYIWAIHNWPDLPIGKIGVRAGPMLAAMDAFDIDIKGRGGHAGLPHKTIDPIAIGAQLINSIYNQVSRRLDATQGGLCSITKFTSGTTHNVIPEDARLAGTVRSLHECTRAVIEEIISDQSKAAEVGSDVKVTLDYRRGYPACINDSEATEIAKNCAVSLLGDENVIVDVSPSMGTEDFAYYLQEVPGSFLLVGQADGSNSPALHTPQYDFNDDIIPIGVEFWLTLVQSQLGLQK